MSSISTYEHCLRGNKVVSIAATTAPLSMDHPVLLPAVIDVRTAAGEVVPAAEVHETADLSDLSIIEVQQVQYDARRCTIPPVLLKLRCPRV
jgi:hypothetical protein